jgi:hypothetical protein
MKANAEKHWKFERKKNCSITDLQNNKQTAFNIIMVIFNVLQDFWTR